ncbi:MULTISPECIES: hypothetical protein [Methylobacterium]|uniref:Morphogenetic protein n=1 Tax=Methylobacterium jeotgali TaxID=381630 RepID=A0ABQ4T3A1_9HYPH|nr:MULTISPECIES: hypothetical protein [Methylobacterium]PIU06953.1 MAG: hypothetical protein COT56_07430 [Methylobacterium sp. CG09_land_8_20_14_0_10_71_15]PIU16165.1 MAG: hypothetical protein COT28_01750 [Methylobacterium sp. CG08_land_8_20_14_0_20_71_15]GBU18075.1 morphogenetic protein [Methylobacterium sp.]GJE08678.1 hypothetical protein AOPFMNJM_4021 [Methylobacterium jeotgali]
MTDRPIIFSAPMVRALFDGRKTQTRRIIRDEVPSAPSMDALAPGGTARHPAPYLDAYCGQRRTASNPRGMSDRWCWWTRDDRPGHTFKVPYVPGDRLWVRETWCHTGSGVWTVGDSYCALGGKVIYRADDDGSDPGIKWFSPLHLSRNRSRLTLHVADVRVQRLQEISEDDAQAEGVQQEEDRYWHDYLFPGTQLTLGARESFSTLWNSLHGADAWDANPWVAAITFTVERANIDASRGPSRSQP